MTGKEQSKLDDDNYSYEVPVVVAEPLPSDGSNVPMSSTTTHPNQADICDGDRIDLKKEVPEDQKHLVGPAGVGGAVLGFVCGGPILSAFCGFGSAYAVRKDNCVGEAARAVGELTLSVQKKAAEIEDKHRYLGRSVEAINKQCDKSKKSCAHKTREFVVSSWKAAENYSRRHQLIERGVEGTGRGVEYVAETISGKKKKSSEEKSEVLFREGSSNESVKYTKVAEATSE